MKTACSGCSLGFLSHWLKDGKCNACRGNAVVVEIDPRGPTRKIEAVHIDTNGGNTTVDLSCGHSEERVSHFSYRVGEYDRCYSCLKQHQNAVSESTKQGG
jgi:hypothetical protein